MVADGRHGLAEQWQFPFAQVQDVDEEFSVVVGQRGDPREHLVSGTSRPGTADYDLEIQHARPFLEPAQAVAMRSAAPG
jgi:hypothetical protein